MVNKQRHIKQNTPESQIRSLQQQLKQAQDTIRDLTGQLNSQKKEYHLLFEIPHVIALLIHPESGQIFDANNYACQFYGYDHDTLTRMKIQDINQLTDEEIQAEMERARTRRNTHFNFKHQLADGEIRDVEVYSGPIELEGQTFLYSIIHDVTERKQEESQSKLLWHAVEQSANSIMITNAKGEIEYVNPFFTSLTGYTLEEVRKKNPRILKSQSASPEEHRRMWETITSGKEWTGEFQNTKKNGETYWEFASISPVKNEKDEITHFVAIKEDITSQKQAEIKRIESENRFRILSELTTDYAYAIKVEADHSYIEWVTHAFTDITGYTIEEATAGNRWHLLVHPDDKQQVAQRVEKLYSGQPDTSEFRIITKSGETRWLRESARPIWDQDLGRVTIIYGAAQDITRRKKAENKIRYERDRAQQYLNIAGSIIIIFDARGNITMINDKGCEVLECTRDKLIGKNWFKSFLAPMEHPSTESIFYELILGNIEVSEHYTTTVTSCNGNNRLISWHNTPIMNDQNQIVGILSSGEDVTEREQMITQLQLEADTQASILSFLTSKSYNLELFIESVLEEALQLTSSEIGYFHFVHDDQENLSLYKWSKGVMEYCYAEETTHYPISMAGIWADCIRTHKPVIHNDYPNEPKRQGLPTGHFPVRRHMSIPILDQDRVVAVLGVGNKPKPYLQTDSDRLMLMCTTLWAWVERKRVEELVAEQNRELSIINDITSLGISSLDHNVVLDIICRQLSATFDADHVHVAISDKRHGTYQIIAESNIVPHPPLLGKTFQFTTDEDWVNTLYTAGQSLIMNKSEMQQLITPTLDEGRYSGLLIPLQPDFQSYLLIYIKRDIALPFAKNEQRIASQIAPPIAQAVENSLLHQKVIEQNTKLGETVALRTQQLENINNRLSSILDNTHDAIMLINSDFCICDTNRSFDAMFGYNQEDIYGQPVTKLVPEAYHAVLYNALKSVESNHKSQRLEITMTNKQGHEFDSDTAITYGQGNSEHIIISIRDITHLKEVERVKDRFVSMVSHELRTPISALLLSADTLSNYFDRLSEAKRQRKIRQMFEQSKRLSELINAILDLSRLDSRQGTKGENKIFADRVLEHVIHELSGMAKEKQLTLDVQIYNQGMLILGEESDFTRIWYNLISNAIKYTDHNGHILVQLYGYFDTSSPESITPDLSQFEDVLPADIHTGNYLIGIVQDDGHGIRSEDLPQLFTRFFRGWAAGTNIPGTGLGLSLVHDILRIYDGNITIHTELDKGSTFCFWIPRNNQERTYK